MQIQIGLHFHFISAQITHTYVENYNDILELIFIFKYIIIIIITLSF